MNIVQYYMTKNPCYIKGKTIKPTGIVVHSTGANNAYLKRYVNPDDGRLGANQYNNHWNKADANKCVHAFIGKLADGTVAVYQTLPWNYRSWGVGAGKNGSYNDSHIQFEICEDGLTNATYYKEAFQAAKELCAYLCKLYGISPDNIVGHYEAYQAGYGSNHGDPRNWQSKHGDSMKQFRADVAEMLRNGSDSDSDGFQSYTVTGTRLALRKATSTKSAVLTRIDTGTVVQGKPYNAEWVQVTHAGLNGYCMAKFLKENEPAQKPEQPEAVEPEESVVISMRALRNGSRGMQVLVLQFLLNQHGYSAGTPDGIFGANTLAAVQKYQKANGLTVDGICGKNTWGKLLA